MKIIFSIILIALAFNIPRASKSQDGPVNIQQQQMKISPAEPPVEAMITSSLDGSLYDLDWALNTSDFKNARTSQEQEEILQQLFLSHKKETIKNLASKISFRKAKIITSGLLLGGASSIIIGAIISNELVASPSLMPLVSGLLFSSYIAAWGALGNQPGGTGDLGIISLLKKYTEAYLIKRGSRKIDDAYTEVEVLFARKYYLLKTKNPRLLSELKTKLTEMRNNTLEALIYYRGYTKIATSVPIHRGTYKFNQEKFHSYFKYYPNNLQRLLRNLAGRLTYFSQGPAEKETINFPVYFIGVPSTGKTHAAKGIAEVIGAPIAHVALDGASIEDVIGTPSSQDGEAKPGRLLTALSTLADIHGDSNYENGILFIDEFDRLLNAKDPQSRALLSFMLKVLDPNNRKFFSPYLNAEIKLPTLIILAGSYEIKDEALSNRFQQIEFNGYDLATKRRITKEKLLPEIASIYGYSAKDFSGENFRHIEEMIRRND